MSTLIADASALVSLGVVADDDPDPLALCLSCYEGHRSNSGHRGTPRSPRMMTYTVGLQRPSSTELRRSRHDRSISTPNFRLMTVKTLLSPSRMTSTPHYCSVMSSINSAWSASLADTRLVTTPTLLSVLVRTEQLSAADARAILDKISDARSWDANSYVQRARSLLRSWTPTLSPIGSQSPPKTRPYLGPCSAQTINASLSRRSHIFNIREISEVSLVLGTFISRYTHIQICTISLHSNVTSCT